VLVVATACSFQPRMERSSTSIDAAADTGTTADASPWWNTAWTVRLPITIANTSGSDVPAGFQIGVPYELDGSPCSSSVGGYSDVRVVDGTTELARVIDAVGPPEWTWFRLDKPLAAGATSSGVYWLYCNNPSAPFVDDQGSAVFDFYDPFDTLDTTRWTVNNNATISNGLLVCSSTGNDNGVVTTATVTADHHAVEFAAAMETGSADWWAGFQTGTADVRPWSLWYQHDLGKVSPSYVDSGSASVIWEGTDDVQDTNEHVYTVEDYDANAVYRLDDLVYQTQPYAPLQPPPTSFAIRLWNNTNVPGFNVSFDWVRLRQSASPAPSITIGNPEM
jgi:hypothetical protein